MIPLAGDLVAAVTRRLGIVPKPGTDCGCPERQEKLNALDRMFRVRLRRLRRWLHLGS